MFFLSYNFVMINLVLESSFLEIDDQGFILSNFDQLWDYTYMEESTEYQSFAT